MSTLEAPRDDRSGENSESKPERDAESKANKVKLRHYADCVTEPDMSERMTRGASPETMNALVDRLKRVRRA